MVSLVPLQASILESAARMVRPGGRVVYATCSLLPEENDHQVEAFLKKHEDFTLRETLRLSPAKDGTDGFFAAAMVRKEKAKTSAPEKEAEKETAE